MSGKRLLDAAAIFKATQGVAVKHAALRRQQWETYNKTSSLAQAVKSQTDRVTVTVRAASALAARFNESKPRPSPSGSQFDERSTAEGERHNNSEHPGVKQGLEQDHFYDKSEANTAADPAAESELGVKQENASRDPLPDGTIPPAGSLHEVPIQEKDSYSEPSHAEPKKSPTVESLRGMVQVAQPLSSGRKRTLMPNNTGFSPAPDHSSQEQTLPKVQAIPEQEQLPEEAYSQLFHSPKIASMLRQLPKKDGSAKNIDLPAARNMPVEKSKSPQEKDRVSSSRRAASENQNEKDGEVHELAADLASDAESTSGVSVPVSCTQMNLKTTLLIR